MPPHITQVTWFGERADWSGDGEKILFLSKTFGDAMELDVATKAIRNLTAHYPHLGYTRALYLSNGDVLLSGPDAFVPEKVGEARVQCWLHVLDRSGLKECDRQNRQGPGHVDLWRLRLDGSRQCERLTHFSDSPGYKASNPVVSDDGRFIAFQMAKSGEAAGIGHELFIYDIEKASSR